LLIPTRATCELDFNDLRLVRPTSERLQIESIGDRVANLEEEAP